MQATVDRATYSNSLPRIISKDALGRSNFGGKTFLHFENHSRNMPYISEKKIFINNSNAGQKNCGYKIHTTQINIFQIEK